MEAIILAGGQGTRLAPRLQGIPKGMAPVGGRPFLQILLSRLKQSGCSRAVLAVGYLRKAIQAHFGHSFEGMHVAYAVEESPLGTGGAVRNALGTVTEGAVLILNGDTFLDADYRAMMAFHHQSHAVITMAITRQSDVARFGDVTVEGGRVTGFGEKGRRGPGWINGGAYVLNRDSDWPEGLGKHFSFEKDFLERHLELLRPAAFRVTGFFLDIGVPEDYDRAQTELSLR